MASEKIYLDTRREKSNGKFPLKIKITIDKSTGFFVPLDIDLSGDQWDGFRVVKHPNKELINRIIVEKYDRVESVLLELDLLPYKPNVAEIKQRVTVALLGDKKECYTVPAHFDYIIANAIGDGTKSTYKLTKKKIIDFSGPTIRFEDIDYQFILRFEQYLSATNKINSVAIHMRNLRAAFNSAINLDKVKQNIYPFRRYKIKYEETRKRSISVEQLRQIRDLPVPEYLQKYRDMFMLSFYLIGINTKDMLNLRTIENGRINYRRAKTHRLYSIKIEPEAMQIIEKYKGKKYLLFPLDTYKDYHDFAHRLNRNLHLISPELTTYWARHTWATIAAELDIPKDTISAALGHCSGSRITNIYINFDNKKIDEANRRVINYLNKKA